MNKVTVSFYMHMDRVFKMNGEYISADIQLSFIVADGAWSEWSVYGECSMTCGSGAVTQRYKQNTSIGTLTC